MDKPILENRVKQTKRNQKKSPETNLDEMSPFAKIYAGVPLSSCGENKKNETKLDPKSNDVNKSIEPKLSDLKLQFAPQVERRAYLSSEQILEIRKQVEEAIKQRKIFYMNGHYRSVRRALFQRGWLEKVQVKSPIKINNETNSENIDVEKDYTDEILEHLPEQKSGETLDQHLKKCEMEIKARMLYSHSANFYWNIKKESLSWLQTIPRDALINRFPKARFTSKEGLCAILQQMHWYTEPGIANTLFPRCYNLTYPDQFLSFVDDFRITSCMSILKTFLALLSSEGEIAVRSLVGNISISAIYFAISRCSEYISSCEHEDIDFEPKKVWDHEWENFFTNVDLFVNQKRRFLYKTGDENIELIKDKITQTLKKMVQYCPQYNLDGNRNIWIVKPGNRCRGQGIILMDKFQSILTLVLNCNPKKHRYVVQKYVERPLLIYDTKFDIRQWFLLTSAQPLILWMYKECYLRFSSQLFSLYNFHESIHLTNNAVQKKYRGQSTEERSKELPDENMWDCHTFKAYLKRIGHYDKWDEQIYPAMKEAIVGAMLASQENMDRKGNYFELYGADFILGQDLVPWLLEINSSPDMSSSTSVTSRMCPQCLEDVVKVVVDRRENPLANTGLFELAYKQQCPRPPAYLGLQLSVRGRRMLRHRVTRHYPSHLKNSDDAANVSVSISKDDLENLLKTNEYQGPIIGDFIEDLQQKIEPVNPKRISSSTNVNRRKRRTNSLLRTHKRTVQYFQPTIKTISMKPKPSNHNPFSFSFSENHVIKKSQLLSQSLKNLTIKPSSADNDKQIRQPAAIKINRRNYTAVCRSTEASELWMTKSTKHSVPPSKSSVLSNSNIEINRVRKGTISACPRLVRSMCDTSLKGTVPKSILHNFLTVGIQFNNSNNNNNLEINHNLDTVSTPPT